MKDSHIKLFFIITILCVLAIPATSYLNAQSTEDGKGYVLRIVEQLMPHSAEKTDQSEIIEPQQIDWSTAKQRAGFVLAKPAELPAGFEMTRVDHYVSKKLNSSAVVATFSRSSDGAAVLFWQEKSSVGAQTTMSFETARVMKKFTVNNIDFIVYELGTREDSDINLYWTDDSRLYKMWGNVPVENLVSIASTVRLDQ